MDIFKPFMHDSCSIKMATNSLDRTSYKYNFNSSHPTYKRWQSDEIIFNEKFPLSEGKDLSYMFLSWTLEKGANKKNI